MLAVQIITEKNTKNKGSFFLKHITPNRSEELTEWHPLLSKNKNYIFSDSLEQAESLIYKKKL